MNTLKKTSLALSVLLSIATTVSRAQEPANVMIHGTIEDMPEISSKIYLVSVLKEKGFILTDSAIVKNGVYQLSGHADVDLPIVGAITGLNTLKAATLKDLSLFLMSAGSTINIVSHGKIGGQGGYEITGSEMAVDFKDLSDKQKNRFDIDTKEISDAQKKGDSAAVDKAKHDFDLKYKEDFITHSARLGTDEKKSFIKEHPQSAIAPLLLSMLYQVSVPKMSIAGLDSLMAMLPASSQAMAKTYIARNMKDKLAQQKAKKLAANKLAVGAPAPDFTQNDVHGQPVRLSSLKGKYVLVDFWASWCVPCRQENPDVVKMYQTYKDKNFTVLGVSLDNASTKDAWLTAIKKDGLAWTEVSDLGGWQNEAAQLYDIKAIPQNFLIGPDGVIIARNLRGEDLQKQLATVIK